MGDENPIRTLGDYSKPSHEGYRNTIELPVGNNVVPLRSDTIRLVQNGCSFHGLRSEDPNQHLKDFLKLVDSLDLDGENRERTRLRLQNSATISLCSNNIKENFFPKHGLVSMTYFKKSLIMASIVGFKFKFFMIMSPFILNARLTAPSAAKFAIRIPTNPGRSLRTSSSMTMRAGMTQNNSSNRSREEEEKSDKYDVETGDGSKKTDGPNMEVLVKEAETKNGAENRAKNKPIKKAEKEEVVEAPSSQPVEYYLKNRINEKLIEGLVDNNRFNDSLSGVRL
ncbi:hypothetical protein Tco_0755084 [Tanacetum coccineum]